LPFWNDLVGQVEFNEDLPFFDRQVSSAAGGFHLTYG
jgi:hypothetical protein